MVLDNSRLQIDIKVSDAYRQYLSSLGFDTALKGSCVILGDSDVDYQLAPNVQTNRILNAPYSPAGVKHKLLYNGVGKNLSGTIKAFARRVEPDGSIMSLYQYNADEVFYPGDTPPTLAEGKNWDQITFDDLKRGYILFFESVLDYYLTADNIKKRISEAYTFTFNWDGGPKPSNWDFVIDNTNGSLLLAKQDTTGTPIGLNYRGTLTIAGQFTKLTKVVTFNF